MALRFDIRNPETAARVERHREELKTRTVFDVEVLHYLKTEAGWVCLDLNVAAPTEGELDAKVAAALLTYSPGDVLPCAPGEMWDRMLAADSLPDRLLRQTPPRGIYLVARAAARAEEKSSA